MRILTRYLIRAHVGPFLFAFTALTGLLFLNAVAIRLEDLAGKGLTFDVIWEFLYLSLPHTIALTFPMSVLVAVLYAFSELAANNEVTAMKAGGIRPQRMLLPLLIGGAVTAGGMLYFNDHVLPEANHRLKNLLIDINRKSPTFALREQVVNEVRTDELGRSYWLTAARIDDENHELFDVAIFDGTDPVVHRTTYADRGLMAFNEARTDLYLTLFDGVVYETSGDEPGGFQQVYFSKQVLPLRGVGNELERQIGGSDRSDREMSIAMLEERVAERRAEIERNREESRLKTVETVTRALGLPVEEAVTPSVSVSPGGVSPLQDGLIRDAAISARQGSGSIMAMRQQISRDRVEIHKKYTLAFACIVFVLIGAPLAIRFPRGGLGLVITASASIVAVYWMGLIGGENLADRAVSDPAITMWIPNLVFTALGLWLFKGMGRESATNRGGGWEDLFLTVRSALPRAFRPRA